MIQTIESLGTIAAEVAMKSAAEYVRANNLTRPRQPVRWPRISLMHAKLRLPNGELRKGKAVPR